MRCQYRTARRVDDTRRTVPVQHAVRIAPRRAKQTRVYAVHTDHVGEKAVVQQVQVLAVRSLGQYPDMATPHLYHTPQRQYAGSVSGSSAPEPYISTMKLSISTLDQGPVRSISTRHLRVGRSEYVSLCPLLVPPYARVGTSQYQRELVPARLCGRGKGRVRWYDGMQSRLVERKRE
eukprot:2984829-Rhodomonas_salina.2